ncbi:MAG: glycoside hydrolase family 28 protein, partial [Chthoniobacterales bacterium]
SYTGEMVTNKMLIYAEDAREIMICGRGMIDGNGEHWKDGPYGFPSFSVRPRILHLRGCENVRICNVTLFNSASWVQSYQSCRNLVIDGITVDSRENKDIEKERWASARGRNTDGLDLIDCQQVRISNCFINSGDDALCLKSYSPSEACRDITVTNCVMSSNASGIKIGTETAGRFEDITVQNCTIFDTRIDALSLITVDGAYLERINFSNISVRNIKGSAIFIRLGKRNTPYRKKVTLNKPVLKDIIIENVQGTKISAEYGASITGIPGLPVENIQLRNINLEFIGGGVAEDSFRPLPEEEEGYPYGPAFGILPAYGFFIRHAKNIFLENLRLRTAQEDERPVLLCSDVDDLEIKGLQASGSMRAPESIRVVDTRNLTISGSRLRTPTATFLSVYGDKSENIVLKGNYLRNADRVVSFEKEFHWLPMQQIVYPNIDEVSGNCQDSASGLK